MRSASEIRFVLLLVVLLVMTQMAVAGNARAAQLSDSADQTLLIKVRQAGLWEMPAGQWAGKRAASPRVKEVGMTLMIDHGMLDSQVRTLAAQLGVALPDQPTVEQQGWLNEMLAARTDAEFDQIFVNRLRAAHGVVFAVVAQVRAGTRDARIRAFATAANQAVLRHITLLESTGLVNQDQLPEPVLTPQAMSLSVDSTDIFTILVLALLLGGATVLSLRFIRGVRTRSRSGESHG